MVAPLAQLPPLRKSIGPLLFDIRLAVCPLRAGNLLRNGILDLDGLDGLIERWKGIAPVHQVPGQRSRSANGLMSLAGGRLTILWVG